MFTLVVFIQKTVFTSTFSIRLPDKPATSNMAATSTNGRLLTYTSMVSMVTVC